MRRTLFVAALSGAVALAGCGGAARDLVAGDRALAGVSHALPAAGADTADLDRQLTTLRQLPEADFRDPAARDAVIEDAVRSERLGSWADQGARAAGATDTVQSVLVVTAVRRLTRWRDTFETAVTDVTKEALRGQACQLLLDQAAPKPELPAGAETDDAEWRGDLETNVVKVLARTFAPETAIVSALDWADYKKRVTDAADQVAASAAAEPTGSFSDLAATPAGVRSEYAFVRYCYHPPTG